MTERVKAKWRRDLWSRGVDAALTMCSARGATLHPQSRNWLGASAGMRAASRRPSAPLIPTSPPG